MQSMKVDKVSLIHILTTNRDKHRDLFLSAQDVYRELVIKELDFMLEEAKNGSSIRRKVNLSPPEDHTNDYDKLIGLLKLSVEGEVELTLSEYSCYVEDNWSWSRAANIKNANYTARNISPMFVGEDASLPSSY